MNEFNRRENDIVKLTKQCFILTRSPLSTDAAVNLKPNNANEWQHSLSTCIHTVFSALHIR